MIKFIKLKVSWYKNRKRFKELINKHHIVDLTEIFGKDNEPSQKQIDKYLKKR